MKFLTTRQVIALRNMSHALESFYSDGDPYDGSFIPREWKEWIDDKVALICEQCSGEGQVGGLTPDGYESHRCAKCDGSGLDLKVKP